MHEVRRGEVPGGGRLADVLRGELAPVGQLLGEHRRPPGPRKRQRVPGERRPTEVRLETPDLTTRARGPVVVEPDMPDVARGTGDSAVHLPAEHDAAPDTGADLDEDEVVERPGDAGVPLAKRHDVDIVVDGDRTVPVTGQLVAYGITVPARHDRRRDRHTVAEAHGPGQTDPGSHQSTGRLL